MFYSAVLLTVMIICYSTGLLAVNGHVLFHCLINRNGHILSHFFIDCYCNGHVLSHWFINLWFSGCAPNQITCDDHCVYSYQICDSVINCHDTYEDEMDCGGEF